MGKGFDFSKAGLQMINKHILKRCSTSPIIRKMQIKTKMRNHSTLIKMAVIRDNDLWNVIEESEWAYPEWEILILFQKSKF